MALQQRRIGEQQTFAGWETPRRHLALFLPRWATDCLKRADPSLASLTAPFALYEKQKGAMRLVALDARAEAAGLFTGQSLSDARALCPALQVREIDRSFIEATFADFADWHSYASPIVAVLSVSWFYGKLDGFLPVEAIKSTQVLGCSSPKLQKEYGSKAACKAARSDSAAQSRRTCRLFNHS